LLFVYALPVFDGYHFNRACFDIKYVDDPVITESIFKISLEFSV
jgi:hypothetical protein